MLPAARALGCCATLLVVLAAAAPPASAGPSTRADRVIAANVFAERTLTFSSQQTVADVGAMRALAARRAAAQHCVTVWRSAPLDLRTQLTYVYFEYLSGALWSVDAALFRHWITDLRRSRRVDRSPVLARAADALRRDYEAANAVYTAVPDACATVTAWRDAGWAAAAAPAVLGKLSEVVKRADGPDAILIDAGVRQVARYARRGKLAADVLRVGLDEPDERVDAHTGCDAIGALLQPDVYVCSP